MPGFSPPFVSEMYQHQLFGASAPPNSLIFFIFFKLMPVFWKMIEWKYGKVKIFLQFIS